MRVALVTTGGAESTSPAIALATAELNGVEDVQLVDRQSIQAVLQEQKLSLSGLIDAERMIQVGKLLKANLLAVVDTDQKGGQALGLVVFDAATGLRPWDAAIPGNPEQAAKSIVYRCQRKCRRFEPLRPLFISARNLPGVSVLLMAHGSDKTILPAPRGKISGVVREWLVFIGTERSVLRGPAGFEPAQ
jgi:hypothetical protein